MGMMIVRHNVRDYGQWRPIFDGHAEMEFFLKLMPASCTMRQSEP